jgi:hypothetical protein
MVIFNSFVSLPDNTWGVIMIVGTLAENVMSGKATILISGYSPNITEF